MQNDILSRYELAQSLIQGIQTNRIVLNDTVFPHWIENSYCFWYIRETRDGKEFRIVDVERAENTPAFNHAQLASALESSSGNTANSLDLPIKYVSITLSPLNICFMAFGEHWSYTPENECCKTYIPNKTNGLKSPDGKKAVFVRDYNLWIQDLNTGKEYALTSDGKSDNFYGQINSIDNTGTSADSSAVQAIWSQDSSHVITHQLDTRNVASRPLVQFAPQDGSLHPKLVQYKMSYPGDEHVEAYRLIAINVHTSSIVRADYQPLPYINVGGGFFSEEHQCWWSQDGNKAFFVDVPRGAKTVRVVEFCVNTGITKILIEESSDTFVKLANTFEKNPLFLPLPKSNELIWFSERTGWGHLYLYDLDTGQLKHAISEGEWLIRDILHWDPKKRELLLQTASRDSDISPYYRDLCIVNIDSGKLTPLVSGNYDHVVYQPGHLNVVQRFIAGQDNSDVDGISPNGDYIVLTRSRVDTAPISVVIDRDGEEILTVETADITNLPESWVWPEPVCLKASDSLTDIYGVIFRPPGFDPNDQYPVLDFSCSHRLATCIPQGSFSNGPVFDYFYFLGAALASLGFIVVAIEGRGTTNRNKAFQDHKYGDVAATCDFNDRIAGLKQLAKRHPYMDLSRVGLTGGDGLSGPAYGILTQPEFYKVAVLHCFFEPRFSFSSTSEQREGISENTSIQLAENYASSLKGKLLLIQGMLDPATPASTFRLVDALQKANKDFDMICLPNEAHSVPTYALRRNWDYLVKHLQDIDPPKEFNLKIGLDLILEEQVALEELAKR